jgi:phosphodiesterase/alkaline phosphatase D-like protein
MRRGFVHRLVWGVGLALVAVGPGVGGAQAGAPGASRPPIPRVKAKTAIGVNATNAVLRAAIDARGGIAHFKFQYGLTRHYETTLEPGEELVTASGYREVTAALTGLRPKTTYYFRVIAFNRSGFTVGDGRSFMTPPRAEP